MPAMYDDLWVAAKGMYKMEPAVADGGEVVIYAPHVREVSHVHGALIESVGYHCRDYFLEQWDRFRDVPGGILAHATHVKGLGSLRRRDRRRDAAHPRDAGDRAFRASAASGSTWATSTRRASTSRPGSRTPTRWSCRVRGRCCTASEPPARARRGRDDSRDRRRRAGGDGRNLALNIESRGFSVAGYDLDPAKTQALVAGGEGAGRSAASTRPRS